MFPPLSFSAGGGGPSGAYGGMASGFSTGAFVVGGSPASQALAITSSAGASGAHNNLMLLVAVGAIVWLALRK
ncbi:MAG: hypothetical protein QM625_22715 [Ralstonia sp.]|uniref:Uncharacterized protein n=1 Tax=Ralstonia pickettii TaxID=329 RepID=A0A7X2HR32_RALPI|nr:hypothetical protein [Ralstonia pickettii]MBX3766559.1 hypothetical protein [Ralstonia pickettii]MBX3777360.1 hypothetical protein [Ralstonia pickettii]MBX3805350.1 hypothetical protein [Ralstonia pickettii]MBX3830084.1 hypothetical protein [Ralstonia pickettii]MBX3848570.1 hypothetical protein [Ralstonia pickettii]